VSGGGAGGSFRASFTNTHGSGIEPSNEYKKNSFNVGVTHDIIKGLKFSTNINYTKEDYLNPPQVGIQGAGSMNFLTRLAMSTPLENYKIHSVNPANGTEAANFRFSGHNSKPLLCEHYQVTSYENIRDRFLGTTTLRYDITDWLYAQGRFNYDYSISFVDNKVTSGIGTSTPTNADGTYKGNYTLNEEWATNINADFLVGATKKFNKFSVDASVGGNTFRYKYHYFNDYISNFTVQDFSQFQTV
jgi:hypothetical protein